MPTELVLGLEMPVMMIVSTTKRLLQLHAPKTCILEGLPFVFCMLPRVG